MFRRFLSTLLAVSLAAMLAACIPAEQNSPAPAISPAPTSKAQNIQPLAFKPIDQLQPAVSKSLAEFSIDLFQRIAAKDSGKNVFISPLSVWLALSMTCNGASGSTAEGMAEALHAKGIPLSDLNGDNAGLMGVLSNADPKVKIAIANSIWMNKAYQESIEQNFIDVNRTSYGAEIEALDFASPEAPDTMNRWVEQKTSGKIKDLIQPPLSTETVMILINAIYFNAPWKQAFDPKLTRSSIFRTAGGSEVPTQFLHRREGNIGYADEDIRIARLPYATGRLEMVAMMPETQSLDVFVKGLTADKLQAYIDKCAETTMSLTFPKFKLDYKATLNDALASMGMKDALDPHTSEFKNMSQTLGDEFVISKVAHRSFIEVDENGTEAAAATAVVLEAVAAHREQLDFTQPFIYLIRDTKTGAILFIGTMENPAQ